MTVLRGMSGCVGMCMFHWRTWSVLETTGSESTRINCCVDRLDFHRKLGGDCKSCLSLCRTVISLLTFWFSCCIILLYSIIVDRFRIAWRRMRVALSASYPDRIFIEPHTTPRTAKPWRSKWWQSFCHLWWLCQKILCIQCLAIPRVWSCQPLPAPARSPTGGFLDSERVARVGGLALPGLHWSLVSHRIRRISESFLQNVADLTWSDMIWHGSAWKIL